ncbi:MAG: hypothetical protein ACK51E_02760 [Gemmatimonadota bacterium]|jgi:hypothetical protein
MFTDQPVTPRRVEILLDVLAEYGRPTPLKKGALFALLQPETLPNFNPGAASPRSQAESALRAARELGLVKENDEGWCLSDAYRVGRRDETRIQVLRALDACVLVDTAVEPYFALFYAYLLGLGARADKQHDDEAWASAFNRALGYGADQPNPFNATKLRGLWRWLPYTGLGWFDNRQVFQCDPYERVKRALPAVFEHDERLDADVFMTHLARACPELDGGQLFRRANADAPIGGKVMSVGLAQALLALHEDEVLVLECPRDGRGWDLQAAEPSFDGRTLQSPRLDAVTFAPGRARRRATAGAVS